MAQENESSTNKSRRRKRPILRAVKIAGIVLAAFLIIVGIWMLTYNNVSITSDEAFAEKIDTSIEQAEKWIQEHRAVILKEKNAVLFMMLRECDKLKPNPVFKKLVTDMMNTPILNRTSCWKRVVDPNWPVVESGLNQLIDESEKIDYKWILYAAAPDKAKVTPEQMDMFNPDRWQWRELTHQLYALNLLKIKKPGRELDKLIEHLCSRLSRELIFDMAVVDIYIQKVAFILLADHPEKIRRRWLERIIDNQMSDGGWNDRWYCFASWTKPVFESEIQPSNEHATVQAVLALYMARYKYPQHFSLK